MIAFPGAIEFTHERDINSQFSRSLDSSSGQPRLSRRWTSGVVRSWSDSHHHHTAQRSFWLLQGTFDHIAAATREPVARSSSKQAEVAPFRHVLDHKPGKHNSIFTSSTLPYCFSKPNIKLVLDKENNKLSRNVFANKIAFQTLSIENKRVMSCQASLHRYLPCFNHASRSTI